jgi:hypothetical protein
MGRNRHAVRHHELDKQNDWGLADYCIHSFFHAFLGYLKTLLLILICTVSNGMGKTVMNSEYEIETLRPSFLSMKSVSAVKSVFRSLHQSVTQSIIPIFHQTIRLLNAVPGKRIYTQFHKAGEPSRRARAPTVDNFREKKLFYLSMRILGNSALESSIMIIYIYVRVCVCVYIYTLSNIYYKRNLVECDTEENMEAP